MALAREHGLPQILSWSSSHHGLALAAQGQAEGLSQARQSIDAQRAMGAELARPNFLSMLAEALGQHGHVDEALATVSEAIEIAERTGERSKEAEFRRVKGELLLKKAEQLPDSTAAGAGSTGKEQLMKEAEESLLQAIRVAQSREARSWELRATVSLCRLWQKTGKREEARAALAEIYNWFTEGFDTVDLKEARALLEELS
jgi:predicted ATPase